MARREDAVADAVVVEGEEEIRKEEDKEDKRIGWPVSILLTRTERFRQMSGPK